MTLTPTFDKDVVEYSAATTNASNSVTAVAEDEDATVEIFCNETEYESGDAIPWVAGENEVIITVTNGEDSKDYTVVVTKGE